VWQHQVPLIEKYLAPKKYFLSMDEVRVGGFCEACQRRHSPWLPFSATAEAQYDMIRVANPRRRSTFGLTCLIQSQRPRQYFLVNGALTHWKYIPKTS